MKKTSAQTTLPPMLPWTILILCLIPFVLSLLGIETGNTASKLNSRELEMMSGPFTHTLLEWSSLCLGTVIMLLAYAHYRLARDITILVIGIAFFFSGVIDAYHMLAVNRLLPVQADSSQLMGFTATVSRLFNAILMLAVIGFFVEKKASPKTSSPIGLWSFIVITGLIAASIIWYTSCTASLPATRFPDTHVTRPYSIALISIYLFTLLFLYPKLYQQKPSPFTHALIWGGFLQVLVELSALGVSRAFDSFFNLAHCIKIGAYLLPLLGLMLDDMKAYKKTKPKKA